VLNKLDVVPEGERKKRVKDFVKKMAWKGPVFEISALNREGCEDLVHAIYSTWKKSATSNSARRNPDDRGSPRHLVDRSGRSAFQDHRRLSWQSVPLPWPSGASSCCS
jgi:putative protein kinase ArgK-like GTPase of G3E family